jgi:multiple sugar transport system permease protein
VRELHGYHRLLGSLLLLISCLVVILPFAYVLVSSLKYDIDIYNGSLFFQPTLDNFNTLLFNPSSPFIRNTINSAIVGVVSTALAVIISTLGAYSFIRFRWNRWLVSLILAWLLVFRMVPHIAIVGPWYLLYRQIGLYDTLGGLILAHLTINLPLLFVLMMGFLHDTPVELEEAALIDGCNRFTAFVRIVVPLLAPGLVAASILAFLTSWNEFALAVNLTSQQTATLPVAIANNAQQWTIRHAEMAAGSVIATIPSFIMIFFGQRFIVKGLTLGAVKS